jgi:hypothetical protein
MAPEVCMVRTAATRKFGLSPKTCKGAFYVADLVNFAILYGIKSQGYCHLVVATIMAILSFGAMCRCSDASRLKWGNIKFEKDLSSFEITFEIRKTLNSDKEIRLWLQQQWTLFALLNFC